MNKTITFTAGLIMVWLIGYLLMAGRGLLIPIIMAIFIWHLLNTFKNGLRNLPGIGPWLSPSVSMILALLILSFMVKVLVDIITNNVNEVILASGRYQENLLHILNHLDERFKIKIMTNLDLWIKGLSIQNILVNIYAVFTALMSSAVLIAMYVVFLFIEQHFFRQKLNALFPQPEHRELVNNIITHIVHDTQTYLGLKTIMSLITAVSSWVIMKSVGLDFAEFWALLIFFLNYIPNIGSILATIFPALLALIQFQSWWPFFIITSGIVTIQFIVGNLIEPKFMGQSLNLSPLVILIALGLWGSIWGILGMFLSVPITVMMMIIFAHFKKTKPIAILLSQDGQVEKWSAANA